MDIIVDAAVAAVNDVVYDLAAKLFQTKSAERLSLVPVVVARAAHVICLINLALILIVVIILKLKGKLPWMLTPKTTILVFLRAASLGWLLHPHTVNLANARAHASLTLLKNTPHLGLVYFFGSVKLKTNFGSFP